MDISKDKHTPNILRTSARRRARSTAKASNVSQFLYYTNPEYRRSKSVTPKLPNKPTSIPEPNSDVDAEVIILNDSEAGSIPDGIDVKEIVVKKDQVFHLQKIQKEIVIPLIKDPRVSQRVAETELRTPSSLQNNTQKNVNGLGSVANVQTGNIVQKTHSTTQPFTSVGNNSKKVQEANNKSPSLPKVRNNLQKTQDANSRMVKTVNNNQQVDIGNKYCNKNLVTTSQIVLKTYSRSPVTPKPPIVQNVKTLVQTPESLKNNLKCDPISGSLSESIEIIDNVISTDGDLLNAIDDVQIIPSSGSRKRHLESTDGGSQSERSVKRKLQLNPGIVGGSEPTKTVDNDGLQVIRNAEARIQDVGCGSGLGDGELNTFVNNNSNQTVLVCICRTCLKAEPVESCHKLYDRCNVRASRDLRRKLRDVTESIDIQASPNPVVCEDCFKAINTAYDFRRLVKNVEEQISQRKHLVSSIDLRTLLEEVALGKKVQGKSGLTDEFFRQQPEGSLEQYLEKRKMVLNNFLTTLTDENEDHKKAIRLSRQNCHKGSATRLVEDAPDTQSSDDRQASPSVLRDHTTASKENGDSATGIVGEQSSFHQNTLRSMSVPPLSASTIESPVTNPGSGLVPASTYLPIAPVFILPSSAPHNTLLIVEDDSVAVCNQQPLVLPSEFMTEPSTTFDKNSEMVVGNIARTSAGPVASKNLLHSAASSLNQWMESLAQLRRSTGSDAPILETASSEHSITVPVRSRLQSSRSVSDSTDSVLSRNVLNSTARKAKVPRSVEGVPRASVQSMKNSDVESVGAGQNSTVGSTIRNEKRRSLGEGVSAVKSEKGSTDMDSVHSELEAFLELRREQGRKSCLAADPFDDWESNRRRKPEVPQTFDLFDAEHDRYFEELEGDHGRVMLKKWRCFSRRPYDRSDPPYLCERCGKVYQTRNMYNDHFKIHTGMDRTVCCYCGIQVRAKFYRMHIQKEHQPPRFSCDRCGRMFRFKCILQKHIRVVHLKQKEKSQCQVCGIMVNRAALASHVRQHDKPKEEKEQVQYQCELCERLFDKEFACRIHLKNHFKKKRIYKCPVCSKKVIGLLNFKNHMTTSHEGRDTKKCQICCKVLRKTESLILHLTTLHGLTLDSTNEQVEEDFQGNIEELQSMEQPLEDQEGMEQILEGQEGIGQLLEVQERLEQTLDGQECLQQVLDIQCTEEALLAQREIEQPLGVQEGVEPAFDIQSNMKEAVDVQNDMEEALDVQKEVEEALDVQNEAEEALDVQNEVEEALDVPNDVEEALDVQNEMEEALDVQNEVEEALDVPNDVEEALDVPNDVEEALDVQKDVEEALDGQEDVEQALDVQDLENLPDLVLGAKEQCESRDNQNRARVLGETQEGAFYETVVDLPVRVEQIENPFSAIDDILFDLKK